MRECFFQAAVLLAALPLTAQSTKSLLILDPTGAVIPGAVVSAPALGWKGSTDAAGRISLPEMSAGTRLSIEIWGFRRQEILSEEDPAAVREVMLHISTGSGPVIVMDAGSHIEMLPVSMPELSLSAQDIDSSRILYRRKYRAGR
jgi:hypothetical protein